MGAGRYRDRAPVLALVACVFRLIDLAGSTTFELELAADGVAVEP